MSRALFFLSLLTCSCTGMPFGNESHGVGSRALEPWGSTGGGGLLYARDGSPVPNQASGAVTTTDTVSRELGPNDGSRPYLLELYQSAVDQKEKLELELSALQRALDEAEQGRLADEAERDGLQLRIDSLQGDVTRLEQQNLEIAGRLATAQIRRLEAEKLLLETTLEWSRFQDLRHERSESPSEELDRPETEQPGESHVDSNTPGNRASHPE